MMTKWERTQGGSVRATLVFSWVIRKGFNKGHLRKSKLGRGKAFQPERWQCELLGWESAWCVCRMAWRPHSWSRGNTKGNWASG